MVPLDCLLFPACIFRTLLTVPPGLLCPIPPCERDEEMLMDLSCVPDLSLASFFVVPSVAPATPGEGETDAILVVSTVHVLDPKEGLKGGPLSFEKLLFVKEGSSSCKGKAPPLLKGSDVRRQRCSLVYRQTCALLLE